jgi:hypothetical protein
VGGMGGHYDSSRLIEGNRPIQITEPARFSVSHLLEHGASGLRKCGSPIEMDGQVLVPGEAVGRGRQGEISSTG